MSSVFAEGFAPVANIIKIKGEAFINKEKIVEGAEVATGMEISLPKKGSYIDIKFQNGHIVRFAEAVVKVESITPKETFFNLVKGKIFSVVKGLTEGEKFQVKTRYASFAVRGTKFFIVEKAKESYLCVCEGVVTAEKKNSIVEVRKDQDLYANQKGKLKALQASEQMITMSNQVFDEMTKP